MSLIWVVLNIIPLNIVTSKNVFWPIIVEIFSVLSEGKNTIPMEYCEKRHLFV